MTEIMFPGGILRVDEGHVWRELSSWIESTNGYGSVSIWKNGDERFHALLLAEAGGDEHRGSSRLGAADAVAQALQCVAMRRERASNGNQADQA